MDLNAIKNLLDFEIAQIVDSTRRSIALALLIPPKNLSLAWEYGSPGDRFDCWLIGKSCDDKTGFVFCQEGFGPSYPWGFVALDNESMGSDDRWYAGLEDTLIGVGILDAPPGYEVP